MHPIFSNSILNNIYYRCNNSSEIQFSEWLVKNQINIFRLMGFNPYEVVMHTVGCTYISDDILTWSHAENIILSHRKTVFNGDSE